MSAELVKLQVFHGDYKIGAEQTARVDLRDSKSTKQLDDHLRQAAAEHGHGPFESYRMRVCDQDGRVLIDSFRTTD